MSSIVLFQIILFYYISKQKHLFEQNTWRYLYLIPSEIIGLMNAYSVLMLSVVAMAFMVYFVMTFKTVSIRIHQLQSILKEKSKRKFHHFRKLYINSIVHQSKSNRVFGKVFLVNLLTNLPSNCITCLLLMFAIENLFNILLFTCGVCQIFLIGFHHIIAAQSNTKMKKLSKQMMKMHVGHQDTVRNTVKLNLFVQDYFTKKSYGFTYGHFGLISMMTFSQVSFRFI